MTTCTTLGGVSTLPKHPHELIGAPARSATTTNAGEREVGHRDQGREHRAAGDERADADHDLGRAADPDEDARGDTRGRAARPR